MSEVDQLRDRIAELEHALGVTAKFPRRFIRSYPRKAGERLLGLLMARAYVPCDTAFEVMFGDRAEAEQPTSENYVRSIVCRLRSDLGKHGVSIETGEWGTAGYYITEENKTKLRALLAELAR